MGQFYKNVRKTGNKNYNSIKPNLLFFKQGSLLYCTDFEDKHFLKNCGFGLYWLNYWNILINNKLHRGSVMCRYLTANELI